MEILQNLEKKQLVVNITGQVTANNVAEFQNDALSILSSINTDLVTDQDFQEARNNIKSCKAIEIHIENAKQKAIMSMDDVAKVMLALDTVKDDFARIRIQLTNADKKRSAERKQEIIDEGFITVRTFLQNSPVEHGFIIDRTEIVNATKNKKSFTSMEQAVSVVVDSQMEQIDSLSSRYTANMAWIEEAERKMPGLFVDKKQLALKDPEIVSAEITARIEVQKRKLQEIEEAKRKKAELEKLRDDAPVVNQKVFEEPRDETPVGFDFGEIADDPFSTAVFDNIRKTLIPRFESGKGLIYLVTEEDEEEVCIAIDVLNAKRMRRELDVAINNL